MSEPIESLLASNPDLSRLAAQVPKRMSAWSDLWVSLREQGKRDARVREVADIFRVGYHCVIDHATAQIGTGGKR